MIFARQSTAIIVTVGPVLDSTGVAVTTSVVGDFLISKNGGAPAALNASATLTHRNTGNYSLSLTATDVNTVGTAEVVINATTNACPIKEITVVEPTTYDVLFADAAPGPASPTNITAGTIATATNVTTVNGLAAGVITAAAIATGAIDADAIADNAIDAASIATGAITAAKFAAGAIDATAIADNAIDAATLATGTITAAKFAAGAIDAAAVAADAATEIANAVWDTDATGRQTQGTFGQAIGDPVADTNTIYAATVTNAAGATVGTDTSTLLTRMGTPTDLGGGATLAANLSDIEGQTDDIGVAGAGLTAINLPDQTMNITGDITGNVSGSVGSVTGAVGSVTGAVGSVTGAVGSVTGNVGGNVTGTVGDVVATVDANITAVTGIIITGTGTTIDPWGP